MFTQESFGNYNFIHDLPLTEGGNDYHKKHMHPQYELIFVADGHVEYQVELKHYELGAGSLLTIRPGDHHYPLFPDGQPYEFYVIRFDSEDLPAAIRSRITELYDSYTLSGTHVPEIFYGINEQWALLMNDPELFHESLRMTLSRILISLLVLKGESRKAVFTSDSFRRIFEYIDRNCLTIRSLEDLSQALHMSRSGISKAFFRQMEVPVMEYIRNRKIVYARKCLASGMTPGDAAEACGFEDYSSFYRNYVKIFGEAPGAGKPAL